MASMDIDQSSEEFLDCPDEVFLFNKSLLERLVEFKGILSNPDKVIPASEIKTEWSNFLEVAIEPAGWQAIWQVSRCVCDKLGLRFPTSVMGTVEQVFFPEHTAVFNIEAVQEDITLPESYEVPLVDLWPLKKQENTALNIDITAKGLDQFRFFYNHIWMPWDLNADDEQVDWATKNLESRIKFHLSLVANKMSPALVSYVRHLLTEAQYIQTRKEMLETEFEEDAGSEVTELMRLNFRLNRISNEIETIENPVLRTYFEKIKFEKNDRTVEEEKKKRYSMGMESKSNVLAICPTRSLSKITASFQAIECAVQSDVDIAIKDSLQDLLDTCSRLEKVFLLPGKHSLTFSEYIFGRGEFLAVESGATIGAKFSENCLLTVHGKFSFSNLTFDCSNVRNGLIIESGDVVFRKCLFDAGPDNQNTSIATLLAGHAKATFDECTFRGFSTAVLVNAETEVELKSCIIEKCTTGINACRNSIVACDSVKFLAPYDIGIIVEVLGDEDKVVRGPLNDVLDTVKGLKLNGLTFEGPQVNSVMLCIRSPVELSTGTQDSEDLV